MIEISEIIIVILDKSWKREISGGSRDQHWNKSRKQFYEDSVIASAEITKRIQEEIYGREFRKISKKLWGDVFTSVPQLTSHYHRWNFKRSTAENFEILEDVTWRNYRRNSRRNHKNLLQKSGKKTWENPYRKTRRNCTKPFKRNPGRNFRRNSTETSEKYPGRNSRTKPCENSRKRMRNSGSKTWKNSRKI